MAFLHASRSRPYPGESVNGDRALAREVEGVWWFAVVDGLGHGPAAALAADLAEQVFATASARTTVAELFASVHQALRGGRGAAMTAVKLDRVALEVGGVGNVTLVTDRFRVSFLPTAGVLGGNFRKVTVAQAAVPAGGRLVLHSDGLPSGLRLDAERARSAEGLCVHWLEHHGRKTDDATVLAVDLW